MAFCQHLASKSKELPCFPQTEQLKSVSIPIAIGVIALLGGLFLTLAAYNILPSGINAISSLNPWGQILGYGAIAAGCLTLVITGIIKWRHSSEEGSDVLIPTPVQQNPTEDAKTDNVSPVKKKKGPPPKPREVPLERAKTMISGFLDLLAEENKKLKEKVGLFKATLANIQATQSFYNSSFDDLEKNCINKINSILLHALTESLPLANKPYQLEILIKFDNLDDTKAADGKNKSNTLIETEPVITEKIPNISSQTQLDLQFALIKKHAVHSLQQHFSKPSSIMPVRIQIDCKMTVQTGQSHAIDSILIGWWETQTV